jgi:NADH dehydrogenase
MVHIFFLIGFRSRFSVFRQWAWTYLTFSDGARLITGSQVLPGWEVQDSPHGDLTTAPLGREEANLDLGSPETSPSATG